MPRDQSANPHSRSITELEYEAAIESGKSVLAFLLDPTAPWPASFMDALLIPQQNPAHSTKPGFRAGHVPALSGLLPPSPAPPGSGCAQPLPGCCDSPARRSPTSFDSQRLTAQTETLTDPIRPPSWSHRSTGRSRPCRSARARSFGPGARSMRLAAAPDRSAPVRRAGDGSQHLPRHLADRPVRGQSDLGARPGAVLDHGLMAVHVERDDQRARTVGRGQRRRLPARAVRGSAAC